MVTFSQSVTFHLNGDEIHAFHVEDAHTDGDAIVYFRDANVLHMGDVYFNGRYPFIDYGAGGSIDGVIDAVGKVLELVDDDTKIIPGHGVLSNKAGLGEYREVLKAIRDAVAAEIDKGKDEDAVVAANPTAPFDEKWGQTSINPELFTRIVYRSMTRE